VKISSSSPKIRILFCDDDATFAQTLTESLSHKLALRHSLGADLVEFVTKTNLHELEGLIRDAASLKKIDLVFCDLGWAGLTLKGVQILHDMQLTHPLLYTVLYTAQDENTAVSQALNWQLDFIDAVVRIDGAGHFEAMLKIIYDQIRKRPTPYTDEKFRELVENHRLFPRVGDGALLALNKVRYFTFIKEKYSGFPQMARERGLDLNNIYRANRRFKQSEFVVFQNATVREIVGIADERESAAIIQKLIHFFDFQDA
jgi:CheY-like chemotaxis protein